MALLEEKEIQTLEQTEATSVAEHDLVQELHQRLDSLCRCSENIVEAEAEGHPVIEETWRELKQREQETVTHLKELLNECLDQGVPQEEF